MTNRIFCRCILALLALQGAGGCGEATSPENGATESVAPADASENATSTGAQPAAGASSAPSGAASTAAPSATTSPTAAAKTDPPRVFNPSFPDRLELFEPPKRAQSTVRRADEHGETVELKGFVRVDEPRVVLAIDGIIAPIPEGGEKYGVEVISIHPPSVVLQRGRARWTATLE